MLKKIAFSFLLIAFSLVPFSCEELESLGLTETEIITGLKEALNLGATTAGTQLSATDGYFGNQALKLLLPPEAKPVTDNLSLIPGGQLLVDELILKMNRGAEKAATKAAPIFANAITSMTIEDGRDILVGSDSAATGYLRAKTYSQLSSAFAPEINTAMNEIGAATAWSNLFSRYNTFANSIVGIGLGLSPVNPDLGQYATGKALSGLFVKVAEEEKLIRDDPAKRTTDILKKVFAEQDRK
jgi:hypothetical protein